MTREMAKRRSPSGRSVRRAGPSRPGSRYKVARRRQSFRLGHFRYTFGFIPDSPRTATAWRAPNGPADID